MLERLSRSLQARLFVALLAMLALTALLAGGATYTSVRREADALFDYQLQQMALSLRNQGSLAPGDRAAFDNPDLDFVVQIWSMDGLAIYSSHPHNVQQGLPTRAVLGFSVQRIAGQPWRVYSTATPMRVVQVAQPLAVRGELAARSAWRSVLPIAATVPLLGLGLWGVLSLSLAPLRRVREAAQARQAGTEEPLPSEGLPNELQPLVAAFNALLQRLDQALHAQRGFVADAAHELRTPLTALRLQLGLLEGAADEEERTRGIARLRAGVDRATHLATQLLSLARAEPESAAAPLQALDLAEVARHAAADAQSLLEARGIELQLQLPASEARVAGDAEALRSALRNLLDNALKHGGAPLRLSLASQDGAWCLSVEDGGRGIAAEDRARALQRFQRIDATAEGSGLGLAIVQAVARRHGATLELDQSPLGGLAARLIFASPGANPGLTAAS